MTLAHAFKKNFLLPEKATTKDGYEFDPREDTWGIPDKSAKSYFYFKKLKRVASDEIVLCAKHTLIWYLQNHSVCHSWNMFNRLTHFFETLFADRENQPFHRISEHQILDYSLRLDKLHEWYLGSLRGFFFKWGDLGYPGIEKEALELLDGMTIKGNRKGWHVLTMCPVKGPFTNSELCMIHQTLNNGFSAGRISNRQYSLTWLFMAIGPRPSQLAELKVGDFTIRTHEGKPTEYLVNVPRVKNRKPRREEFTERALIEPVGKVLYAWCEQVKYEYNKKINNGMDVSLLPMFPVWGRTDVTPGFEYHADGSYLRRELQNILGSFKVISHRTSAPMLITPTRFRYTLATRAAIEKAGPHVIAELLDHLDTQHVLVYVQNSDELLAELDAELSDDLEPLAQAFFGKVILFEDADLSDPTKLIRYPGIEPEKARLGSCRHGGECGGVIPIACYICGNFTAFSNGPHEQVLEWLLAEKDKEMRQGGDKTVAGATDAAIEAVKAVIQKCAGK